MGISPPQPDILRNDLQVPVVCKGVEGWTRRSASPLDRGLVRVVNRRVIKVERHLAFVVGRIEMGIAGSAPHPPVLIY